MCNNNKLDWSKHTHAITSSASRNLSWLQHHLRSCSPKASLPLTFLTIGRLSKNVRGWLTRLPQIKLEYCSSIWDPYCQQNKLSLETIQHLAICLLKYWSLLTRLVILKKTCHMITRLVVMYKIIYGLIDIDATSYLITELVQPYHPITTNIYNVSWKLL